MKSARELEQQQAPAHSASRSVVLSPWVAAVLQVTDSWSLACNRPQPAEITPWLLLSDAATAQDAKTLKLCGVSHVLNMAGGECDSSAAATNANAAYKRIDAYDHPDYPLLPKHWREAWDFIRGALDEDDKDNVVLVHCVAGVNRSGLVACAALMVGDRVPVVEAVTRCKVARGTVLYNRAFQRQLVELAHDEGLLGPHPEQIDSAAGSGGGGSSSGTGVAKATAADAFTDGHARECDKAVARLEASLEAIAGQSGGTASATASSAQSQDRGDAKDERSVEPKHSHSFLADEQYDEDRDEWIRTCACGFSVRYERV